MLVPTLRAAGLAPRAITDFGTAKEALANGADLLISDVKLGAFNGLHLAIRACVQGTPTVLIGELDRVLEAEARRQHAAYLTPPVDHSRLLAVVREQLSAVQHTRRSTRKQVPQIEAFADDIPARVLDVSYEGMRLETVDAQDELPPNFTIRLPLFNFSCDVQQVWSAAGNGNGRLMTGVSCVASLATEDADQAVVAVSWRDLVDALPGLAVTV